MGSEEVILLKVQKKERQMNKGEEIEKRIWKNVTKRGRKISQQTGDQSYKWEKQTKTEQSEIKGGFYWFTQQEEKAAERYQYIQESVKEYLATLEVKPFSWFVSCQRNASFRLSADFSELYLFSLMYWLVPN